MSTDIFTTSWELTDSIEVPAAPAELYVMVSDITRMGEWSPECRGGTWVSGTAGTVGARFHGFNAHDGMAWVSESEVIEAEPDHAFGFSVMRFRTGGPDDITDWIEGSALGDMTWRFVIEAKDAGSVLTQEHVMRCPSPFYRGMLEATPEDERLASLRERKEILRGSMAATLQRIKDATGRRATA